MSDNKVSRIATALILFIFLGCEQADKDGDRSQNQRGLQQKCSSVGTAHN